MLRIKHADQTVQCALHSAIVCPTWNIWHHNGESHIEANLRPTATSLRATKGGKLGMGFALTLDLMQCRFKESARSPNR